MSKIQISDLTYGYESSSEPVFEHLNLVLDSSWKLGLTGRNGRGKTTLLHLLENARMYPRQIQSKVSCFYYPCQPEDPSLSVMEIFQDLCRPAEDWEFFKELTQLGWAAGDELYVRPFSSFSPGEQGKILLACLFLKQNGFVLLDEPESSLDFAGRASLCSYLKSKKGFILVSHDRDLLDAVTDHTLAIEKKQAQVQKGNFSSWYETFRQKEQAAAAQHELLKKETKRLETSMERSGQWAQKAEQGKKKRLPNEKIDRGFMSHKAAKLMKRAQALERRQEQTLKKRKELLKTTAMEENAALQMETLPLSSKVVLQFSKTNILYGGLPALKRPASFVLHPGERLQLQGRNGSGKSSLIRLAARSPLPHTGTVFWASGLKISMVPQIPEDFEGTLWEYAQKQNVDPTRFLMFLKKLGMERSVFEQSMHLFSMGERKKAAIALSLCTPAHLYLWDEPLAHLDVVSRMQIEEMILESRPTLLFVEHDERFSRTVATRIFNLESGLEAEL